MKMAFVVCSFIVSACDTAKAPEAIVVAPALKSPAPADMPTPRRGARIAGPACKGCECVGRADGEMFCSGTGFNTCVDGKAVYRSCGAGTSCVPVSADTILCDWPQ